jgi:hypothetical protein
VKQDKRKEKRCETRYEKRSDVKHECETRRRDVKRERKQTQHVKM